MAKSKINLIKNLSELKEIFTNDDKKSILALSLLDKAEFMEETLQKLQEKVKNEGVVTEMCQGKYNIDRANPALQAYNVTVKNYTSVIKQLNDMIPIQEEHKDDNFEDFGDEQ